MNLNIFELRVIRSGLYNLLKYKRNYMVEEEIEIIKELIRKTEKEERTRTNKEYSPLLHAFVETW